MFINNRIFSLAYKLVVCGVCLFGLILNLGQGFEGYVLLYYSIASSIFCLVFYIISAIVTGLNIKNTGQYGVIRFAPHFKGAVVMAMLMNMMVYQFLISDSLAAQITNILMHFILPLMVLVDWALFDRKGRFVGTDPLIWTVIPFAYYAIILVAAMLGVTYYGNVHYPYRFIDPERVLWAPVLVNLVLIVGGYLVVGYLFFGVDRLLGNKAKRDALAAAEERASTLMATDSDDYTEELFENRPVMEAAATGMGSAPDTTVIAEVPAAAPAAPATPEAADVDTDDGLESLESLLSAPPAPPQSKAGDVPSAPADKP